MTTKRNTEFMSLREGLEGFLQESKLQKGLDVLEVKEVWAEIMGPGVANYTHSLNFKNGMLTVQLTSSVLREELSYGLDKIIAMLNKELSKPLIKKIKLQ